MDARGDGGYVIAPGSQGAVGGTWEFTNELVAEVADAPEWLAHAFRNGKLPEPANEEDTQEQPEAEAEIDDFEPFDLTNNEDTLTSAARTPMLEVSPFEVDGGKLIGRDLRLIPAGDGAGRPWPSGMKAIRARCLDCCGHEPPEVRKCVSTTCALWPLRMGAVPTGWREAVALSSESEGEDGR